VIKILNGKINLKELKETIYDYQKNNKR